MSPDTNGAAAASSAGARAGAKSLFGDQPGLRARLQTLRPLICPVDDVLEWVPERATVFDIGCGAGLLPGLLALRRHQAAICGVDASPHAIAIARALADRVGTSTERPPLEFNVTTSTDEWPSGPFGVVMMVDVLHHIPPSAQRPFVSAALARVAPGGRFVYKDMARRPVLHAVANRLHDLVVAREWIHYVDPHVIGTLANEAGLTPLHASHHRRWWYAHDLLVFERRAPAHETT